MEFSIEELRIFYQLAGLRKADYQDANKYGNYDEYIEYLDVIEKKIYDHIKETDPFFIPFMNDEEMLSR